VSANLPPLISAADLLVLPREGVRIFDCRFDLMRPAAGREAYLQGHLPGALHADLDQHLSAPAAQAVCGGRHPLPQPAVWARTLGALGVMPGQHIVAYDAHGGMFAARLWWMLRWAGHARVQVLDGGLSAWQGAGGALQVGEPDVLVPGADYPLAATPGEALIDADTLARRLGRAVLIDARAAERYRGEVEPLDPVAGHIPGALNRPFAANLGREGRFLAPEALRTAFAPHVALGGAENVVHQCGSGVTACHNLLAMAVAGLPGAALYAGSWSEWCSDPARPVAHG
jgi:thiosulfate/3-mercaptopyruvate sulfurtransferase